MAGTLELDELYGRLGVRGNPKLNSKYESWLDGAIAAAKRYCHWDFDFHEASVEYYTGSGTSELVLRTPFVSSDTVNLAVYVDVAGAYGQKAGAYAADTKLTLGTDYALRLEGPYGKSGILDKLGIGSGTQPLFFPSDLVNRSTATPGGLAWGRGPYWPKIRGNIKVVCDYGFVEWPEDLKEAITRFVATIRTMADKGFPVTSEGLADYNYSGALGQWQELGTVRQLLSAFRDVAI